MSAKQSIETMTPQGSRVEITLEDWVEVVIDRALEKHKIECPVKTIEKRVSLLESKMSLVLFIGSPALLALLAWVGNKVLNLI